MVVIVVVVVVVVVVVIVVVVVVGIVVAAVATQAGASPSSVSHPIGIQAALYVVSTTALNFKANNSGVGDRFLPD